VLLGWLSLVAGGALVAISAGPFSAAMRDFEDTPDTIMVGFGVAFLVAGLGLLWLGWRIVRR